MGLPPVTQLVIQELRQPVAYVVCGTIARDKAEGGGVAVGGATSSETITGGIYHSHYAGDMPLLPDGALSSEIARDLEQVAKAWRAHPRV